MFALQLQKYHPHRIFIYCQYGGFPKYLDVIKIQPEGQQRHQKYKRCVILENIFLLDYQSYFEALKISKHSIWTCWPTVEMLINIFEKLLTKFTTTTSKEKYGIPNTNILNWYFLALTPIIITWWFLWPGILSSFHSWARQQQLGGILWVLMAGMVGGKVRKERGRQGMNRDEEERRRTHFQVRWLAIMRTHSPHAWLVIRRRTHT